MNRPRVVGQPTTQQHFSRGINILADLLGSTLGPTGGRVASATDRSEKFELLNDSSTVVRRIISLGTPELDVGAMSMRNVVWQVGQRVGDGGATTALLMRALYNEGLRLTAAGFNAMTLVDGVRQAVEIAVESVRSQAKPIESEDELAAAARTITGERILSAVLGEMSYLLGADAHVSIEKFVAPYLVRRYIAGAHYSAEIASMYFYTDSARRQSVLAAPAIVVVDERLAEVEQVVPLLEAALERGHKALVIVANEVSGAALSLLVSNHQAPKEKKKLDLLAVKLKSVGEELRWAKTDLALMTGAQILGPQEARTARNARPADLGETQRVEFGGKAVVVVANRGERTAIQSEVDHLRSRIEAMPLDDEERPKLVRRLAALSGGIGELKIGAYSKAERELLYEQAERTLKVLSAAQRGGVVPGAGAALFHTAGRLAQAAKGLSGEAGLGLQLLAKALSAPLAQIMVNSGVSAPAVYLHRVAEAGSPATFDAVTGQVVDAFDAGILDGADITVEVLRTAVSGALMLLSTDAIVYHRKPEQKLTP